MLGHKLDVFSVLAGACVFGKNICFKAKHIAGVNNILADALSLLQLQTFKQLAPACMNPHPTEIPNCLQPRNWHQ